MSKSTNIIPQIHPVSRAQREELNGHKAMLVWFTGLSGSGKSTLAGMLVEELHSKGIRTYILDGDNIRGGLNKDLSFSDTDRQENIRRIAEVARLFVDAGMVVITAFISPFKAERLLARNLAGSDSFMEVFVDCPIDVCEQRDVKGLYKKARNGEIPSFTGIDSPFEKPEKPDVIIRSDAESLEESLEKLKEYILPRLKLKRI